MTYTFEAGRIYRMPTHFGPAPGPRQMPEGIEADYKNSPKKLSVAASFLTDPDMLDRHLPQGFALSGEPVVTVEFHYLAGIDWLAGRGYTMITVSWPATYAGLEDTATGSFLAVIWENSADPIITGRGEIGHPKLYADIPEPRHWNGAQICSAGWDGFRFLDLTVSDLRDASTPQATAHSDGIMMLKYIPKTGAWGESELEQVTLTPIDDPDKTIVRRQTGTAELQFQSAAWSDLPTLYHVVNGLAALPVIEMRGGSITESHGGKTFLDQRVLR